MKNYLLGIVILGVLAGCKGKQKTKQAKVGAKPKIELTAEVPDLANCESVVYDKKRGVLYVSMQAGVEPGDGGVAKVSLDGKVVEPSFVSGLNDPKGICLLNDKLYITDVTELVEFDLDAGSVSRRFKGEGAEYFNDVASDREGNLYVADMFISAIYKLDKEGNFEQWMHTPELENPNGLLADKDELYLASWGKFDDKDPIHAPQAHFIKLNLKTKKITHITEGLVGNLDGIQKKSENEFLLTDWITGKLLKMTKDGKVSDFMQSEQSTGDFLYLADKKQLVLPVGNKNMLRIYKVAE
ncbi:MAG: SMP-30/gluconolactonase/LRE family protein [Cytophagales bacterium]|nr:SMP-30/gluconolactonase/LRE family protein [Cytophagales bacterium]